MSGPRGVFASLRELSLRLAIVCSVLFVATVALADSVIVVQASTSAPNLAERNYAASMTRNMVHWLGDVGVSNRIISDTDVSDATLAGTRVALLPYNPNPPAGELGAFRRFVGKGGKLIVFFGGSPELASLMGFQLGDYAKSNTDGQWGAIRTVPTQLITLPALIQQDSHNIRPALPAGKTSTILAYWESADGRTTKQPALTLSPAGFWMSHVLLADADLERKGRLLLAMVGYCDPSVWPDAAKKAMATQTRVSQFQDFTATVRGIQTRAAQLPNADAIDAVLSQAETQYKQVTQLFANGRFAAVVEALVPLRERLITAYAMAQVPRAGELRGVWDHSGRGLYPGNWDKTASILKQAGFTDVFANMLWPWMTHGKLKSLPESMVAVQYGDQIKLAADACHKQQLRFHVWKVCWKVEDAPEDYKQELRKAGRLQVDDKGASVPWLCPSQPININMELASILETARRYPIDGIHLDYIRYDSPHSCYCPRCRLAFEKQTGATVRNWPADVSLGTLKPAYDAWRASQISTFVHQVRWGVYQINSNIQISAAVYGEYPHCGRSIAQDWGVWLQKGYVHFVCPMDYSEDLETFVRYTDKQVALPGTRGRIFPGIGVTAKESQLDAAQVIDQILATRQHGAAGFMLFDLSPVLEKEILPYLSLGVMRP